MIDREKEPDLPRLTGRFSYCSYAKDLFAVVFIAYKGSGSMLIARNLTKDEASELITSLNNALYDFKREFIEGSFIEDED